MTRRSPSGAVAARGRGPGRRRRPAGRRDQRAAPARARDGRSALLAARHAGPAARRRDRRRSTTRRSHAGGGPRARSTAQRHADVIGELTKAGASVIAYDVQFTEPSGDRRGDRGRQRADRGGARRAARSCWGRPRSAPRRQRRDLRRRRGLRVQRRHAGNIELSRATSTAGSGGCRSELDGLETFAIAAARLHTGGKRRAPARRLGLDRLPGPAGHRPDAQLRRRRAGQVRRRRTCAARSSSSAPRRRARKDVHATSTSRDAMRARDPGGRDRDRARRLPARRRRGLARRARWRSSLLAADRPAGRAALRRRGRDRWPTFVAAVAYLVVAQLAFNGGHDPRRRAAARRGGWSARSAPWPCRNPGARAARRGCWTALTARRRRQPADAPAARAAADRAPRVVRHRRALVLAGHARAAAARARARSTRASASAARSPPPDDVVVVGIDDKTFTEPPSRDFPFDRGDHAKVIRHLAEAGAKVIAYDVAVQRAERRRPKGGRRADRGRRGRRATSCWRRPRSASTAQPNVFYSTSARLGLREPRLRRRRAGTRTTVADDADGRIRRMPLPDRGASRFPIVAARHRRGRSPSTCRPGD